MKTTKSILIFLLLFVAALTFYNLQLHTSQALSLSLRCPDNMSGILRIEMIKADGTVEKAGELALETACNTTMTALESYQREQTLKFTLNRDGQQRATLLSSYGKNIQSENTDAGGFYLILALTNTAPFLANDQI